MVKTRSPRGNLRRKSDKVWRAIVMLCMAIAAIPLALVAATIAQATAITDFAIHALTIALALMR